MTYGNLVYNNIYIYYLFEVFPDFRKFEVQVGILGVFCITNCYFECVYRGRCIFCI